MTTVSMVDTGQRTSWSTRLLSLILALSLLMVSMFALPVRAFAQSSSSNDSGELDSSTIFSVASAASNYIDIMLVNGQSGQVQHMNVGNVAGGLGAIDTDSTKTLSNDSGLTEQSANNVSTRAYTTANFSSSSDLDKQVAAYGRYGAALNYLGLDETAPEQTSDLFRMISGRALQFFWFMSSGVDAIMGWACKILQALNPFGFLSTSEGPVGAQNIVTQFSDADLQDASTSKIGDTGMGGVIGQIQTAFSDLYTTISHISWQILMPFFLAFAVFALVFGKAVDQSMYQKGRSQAKRWLVRVIFILAAVPILGGIYTPILNGMTTSFLSSTNTSNVKADAIVASQLVDFQSWAYASHLNTAPLDSAGSLKVEYSGESLTASSVPSDNCMVKVRTYARNINNQYGHLGITSAADTIGGNGTVLGLNNQTSTDTVSASMSNLGLAATEHERVINLMERYSTGARYDSATFASAALMDLTGTGVEGSIVREWRLITSDPANYAENLESSLQSVGTSSSPVEVKPRGFMGEDAVADIGDGRYVRINGANKEDMSQKLADAYKEYIDGGSWDDFQDALDAAVKQESTATEATPGADQDKIDEIKWLRDGGLTFSGASQGNITYSTSGSYGLSTIGMYNYLSTVFASDGMHIYSAKETQNLPSRASHYSVTSIGTGAYGILLMADSIVVLMVFSLIGVAYALSMLFSNLKRGIQALVSLPFAMLGVLNSMARVVMLILMMVVDLCTVFFLYQIVCQGIAALNDALTTTIAHASTALSSTVILPANMASSALPQTTFGLAAAGGALNKVALACLLLILAIAMLIGFMILALRIRRGVINVSNEAISRVVEKVFESRGGTDAKSNVGQKAAAGAALGASMMVRGGGVGTALGAGALGLAGGSLFSAAKGSSAMAQGAANLTGAAGDDSSAKTAGSSIAGLSRQAGVSGGNISGTISGDKSGTVSGVMNDVGFDTSMGKGGDAQASSIGGTGSGGDAAAATAASLNALGEGGTGGAGVGTAAADSQSNAAGYGEAKGGTGYGEGEGYGMGQGGAGYSAASLSAAADSDAFGSARTDGDASNIYGVKADSSSQGGLYGAGLSKASYKSLGGQDSQYAPGEGEGTLGASVAAYGNAEAAGGAAGDGSANAYGTTSDSSLYGVQAQPAGYSPLAGSTEQAGAGASTDAESSASSVGGAGAEGGVGYGGDTKGVNAAGFANAQLAGYSASGAGGAESTYGTSKEAGLGADGSNAYATGAASGNPLAVSASDAHGATASAEGGAQNQFAPDNMNSAEASAQAEDGFDSANYESNQEAPKGVQIGQPAVQVDAKSGDVSTGNLSGAVYDSSLGAAAGGGTPQQQQERMAKAVEQGMHKASASGAAGLQNAPGAPGASAPGGAAGAPGAGGAKGVPGPTQTGLGTAIGSSHGGVDSSNGIRGAKASPHGGMPQKSLGDAPMTQAGARHNRAAAAAAHADYLRKQGGASMASESFNSAPGAVKAMGGASGPASGGVPVGNAVQQQTSLSPDYGQRTASGGSKIDGSRHSYGSSPQVAGAPYGVDSGGYGSKSYGTPNVGAQPTLAGYGGGGQYGAGVPSGPSHQVSAPVVHGGQGGTSLNAATVNSAMKTEDIARRAAEERARQRSLEGTHLA